MKIYYVTLNTLEEARLVGRSLLEQSLAVCVNWFPITCAYVVEGKIKEEPEVVLVIKTQEGYHQKIEQAIAKHITYPNLIAEISPTRVNQGFADWLDREVPSLIPPGDTIELS